MTRLWSTIGIDLDPAQRAFFLDKARVQAVIWHRRKGKDFVAAGKAVFDALESGQDWYIVSLTQRQADQTFRYCIDWAKRFIDVIAEHQVRESEYAEYDRDLRHTFVFKSREIVLPNGARIVSLPGRDPDKLAGIGGNLILTEFGLFPGGGYDHWRVLFPIITRGSKVIAISTPRSKQTKFYELCTDDQTYSVHRCDIHRSLAEGYVLRDQKGDPTDLATFKRLYGDDAGFEREFELQFTGDLSTLIRWALLEAAGERGRELPFTLLEVVADAGWDPETFRRMRAADPFGGRWELGWDVARRGDISVLAVNQALAGDDRHLRALVLMRDTTFALQREIVTATMDADARAVGRGDATGLGADSNETLESRYGDRWRGVPFTVSSKSELGSGLATAFIDASQTLPPMDGPHKFVATDLYAISKQADASGEVDESGKGRLKLVEGENPLLPDSHCDVAYALALAIAAGHGASSPTPAISTLAGLGGPGRDPLAAFVAGEAA